MSKKVLLGLESPDDYTTHVKGFDSFTLLPMKPVKNG